ncbi:MAG: NADAR family protein [Catenulispora sp.]|nr:NADAR family protein [Catenulispora sp.]
MTGVDGLPGSVDEAVAAERAGRRVKYLFFWGHSGGLRPSCLSQWWPVRFSEGGREFASAEHYMMAHKAWLFGDDDTAERVLAAGHPGEAKELGRGVRGFDDRVWVERRFEIVVRGSVLKFGQHDELREYLLETGNRVLVEASPVDRVWGIGLAADDERAGSPRRWRGLNLLGFALMAARQELAARGTGLR